MAGRGNEAGAERLRDAGFLLLLAVGAWMVVLLLAGLYRPARRHRRHAAHYPCDRGVLRDPAAGAVRPVAVGRGASAAVLRAAGESPPTSSGAAAGAAGRPATSRSRGCSGCPGSCCASCRRRPARSCSRSSRCWWLRRGRGDRVRPAHRRVEPRAGRRAAAGRARRRRRGRAARGCGPSSGRARARSRPADALVPASRRRSPATPERGAPPASWRRPCGARTATRSGHDAAERMLLACTASRARSPPSETGRRCDDRLPVPRGAVAPATGRYAICKTSGRPGEGSFTRRVEIPLPKACGG